MVTGVLGQRTKQVRQHVDCAVRNLEVRAGKTWVQICEPWVKA